MRTLSVKGNWGVKLKIGDDPWQVVKVKARSQGGAKLIVAGMMAAQGIPAEELEFGLTARMFADTPEEEQGYQERQARRAFVEALATDMDQLVGQVRQAETILSRLLVQLQNAAAEGVSDVRLTYAVETSMELLTNAAAAVERGDAVNE